MTEVWFRRMSVFKHINRREMLICMRAAILVWVVVMVLMVGVGVVCVGAFFLSVVEVDCLGVIFF